MGPRTGFWIAAISLAFCATTATGGTFSRVTMARLAALPSGHSLVITGFPAGPSHSAAIRFERAEIYAPGAHLYVIGPAGRQEVPRSNLVFLRGYSDDGSVRVALALASDGSFDSGSGEGPEGSFVLGAAITASGAIGLGARPQESATPAGTKLGFTCGNEFDNLDVRGLNKLRRFAAQTRRWPRVTLCVSPRSPWTPTPHSCPTCSATTSECHQLDRQDVQCHEHHVRTRSAGEPQAGRHDLAYRSGERSLHERGRVSGNGFPGQWHGFEQLRIQLGREQDRRDQDVRDAAFRQRASAVPGRRHCCSASGIAWIGSYCQTGSNGGSYSLSCFIPISRSTPMAQRRRGWTATNSDTILAPIIPIARTSLPGFASRDEHDRPVLQRRIRQRLLMRVPPAARPVVPARRPERS